MRLVLNLLNLFALSAWFSFKPSVCPIYTLCLAVVNCSLTVQWSGVARVWPGVVRSGQGMAGSGQGMVGSGQGMARSGKGMARSGKGMARGFQTFSLLSHPIET